MSIKFNQVFVRFLEDKVEGHHEEEIVASPMWRGEDSSEPATVRIYHTSTIHHYIINTSE